MFVQAVPFLIGIAYSELLQDAVLQASFFHICVARICLLRKSLIKERCSLAVYLVVLFPLLVSGGFGKVHLDAVFFAQLLTGFYKIQIIVSFGEFYDVAGGSAAEASKDLLLIRHNKRRGLFTVKRTYSFIVGACPLKRNDPAYHVYNIKLALQIICSVSGNDLRHSCYPPKVLLILYYPKKSLFLYFFQKIFN